MRNTVFDRSLGFFYVIGLTAVALILLLGMPYYTLPLIERPHADLHEILRPAGNWGHGLGIIGTCMILLLFLYSARKKHRFGLRFGRLNRWLDVHIFFGIVGPLLITLHTAMKFGGIVSISYFSMLAVMFSGIFGRYIYMQIPRDTRGGALSLQQVEKREEEIALTLRDEMKLPEDVLERINGLSRQKAQKDESSVRAIFGAMIDDMTMPYRVRRLRRYLRHRGKEIPQEAIRQIVNLARERSVLKRRLALLSSMKHVFHLWHVLHRPFAYIMIVIMFVHVIVTVAFGYRWIF